jgi:hypothetical protein
MKGEIGRKEIVRDGVNKCKIVKNRLKAVVRIQTLLIRPRIRIRSMLLLDTDADLDPTFQFDTDPDPTV